MVNLTNRRFNKIKLVLDSMKRFATVFIVLWSFQRGNFRSVLPRENWLFASSWLDRTILFCSKKTKSFMWKKWLRWKKQFHQQASIWTDFHWKWKLLSKILRLIMMTIIEMALDQSKRHHQRLHVVNRSIILHQRRIQHWAQRKESRE